METKDLNVIALMFDTSKMGSCYGDEALKGILSCSDLKRNTTKMVLSCGDILDYSISVDITPFIIQNEICTIKRQGTEDKGVIFSYIIEGINLSIAKLLDQTLRDNMSSSYLGMTSVNVAATDTRKQFWKKMLRRFSIEMNVITVFRSEEEDCFYEESIAKEYGYVVRTDGFPYDCFGTLPSSRQSSVVKSYEQLDVIEGKNDSSRGIMEMNYAFVKELSIAGTMIWNSIESINKIKITPRTIDYINVEHIYISIYYAAQGVERLLKIATEMILYKNNYQDKENVEELLFSHNHPALYEYINKYQKLNASSDINKLLKMLFKFYDNVRYSRYSFNNDDKLELKLLQDFFTADTVNDDYDSNLKHHYGKALGKLSQELYKLIRELSLDLNIYIYEGASYPVASYVLNSYYGNDIYETLLRIEIAKKELLWYLIKNGNELSVSKIFGEMPPLEFEECYIHEYMSDLISNKNGNYQLHNDVDTIYDDMCSEDKENWKKRLEAIELLTEELYLETDEEDID